MNELHESLALFMNAIACLLFTVSIGVLFLVAREAYEWVRERIKYGW